MILWWRWFLELLVSLLQEYPHQVLYQLEVLANQVMIFTRSKYCKQPFTLFLQESLTSHYLTIRYELYVFFTSQKKKKKTSSSSSCSRLKAREKRRERVYESLAKIECHPSLLTSHALVNPMHLETIKGDKTCLVLET